MKGAASGRHADRSTALAEIKGGRTTLEAWGLQRDHNGSPYYSYCEDTDCCALGNNYNDTDTLTLLPLDSCRTLYFLLARSTASSSVLESPRLSLSISRAPVLFPTDRA